MNQTVHAPDGIESREIQRRAVGAHRSHFDRVASFSATAGSNHIYSDRMVNVAILHPLLRVSVENWERNAHAADDSNIQKLNKIVQFNSSVCRCQLDIYSVIYVVARVTCIVTFLYAWTIATWGL